jgi:hypothetical protein
VRCQPGYGKIADLTSRLLLKKFINMGHTQPKQLITSKRLGPVKTAKIEEDSLELEKSPRIKIGRILEPVGRTSHRQ